MDTPLLADGAIAAMLQLGAARLEPQAAEHPYLRKMRDGLKPMVEMAGNVGIIPVNGALMRKPDPFEMAWGGVEDTDTLRHLVDQAAADPNVSGILLDVDSPGGFYSGGPELADAVKAARASKPVVAWTGGMMASLAYWVGSQADSVIASRSAAVGSIGVYIAIPDTSKMYEAFGIKVELFVNREGDLKAAGMPGTSLTDPQREHFQGRAQTAFVEFRRSVKTQRPGVTEEAMRGQTLNGTEAKNAGLVDRIGDRTFALAVLRGMIRQKATS